MTQGRGIGSALLFALLFAMMAWLAGCASAPVVRLHTLVSADLAVAPVGATAVVATAVPVLLQVGRLPAQVDQPQWLVRQPDDTLLLLEQERWAAPLRDELRAALLQVLAARHGAVDASGAGDAGAAWRVTVDVTRFESLPAREARLDAAWVLTAPGAAAPALACRTTLREPVADGAPALAAGHRRAVAALADRIGGALRAGAAATCAPLSPPG